MSTPDLLRHIEAVNDSSPVAVYGKVQDVVGLTIEATGPSMKIGDLCYVRSKDGEGEIPVEVVGFKGGKTLLMALGDRRGIGPDSLLVPTYAPIEMKVSRELVGRVVDGLGRPIDSGPPLPAGERVNVMARPPRAMERKRIDEPIATGVRSMDACVTSGKGQRVGIMAGSGVGKSKLLGMIARNTNADINVIALIGERGREVRDFIEGDLGEEGLSRSIVVVATSDEPALVRIKGAYLATAIAEWFRDEGSDVMLMMDSVTRFAMAQREVGLAVGEPPTTKGYPPSVFSTLPVLLERAGQTQRGSITGFYTVLIEADDMHDPIGDAVRSILDGHVLLSRDMASRGHYPAIDLLNSISRVMVDVADERHQLLAQQLRNVLAVYRDAEDLVNIGAYTAGANPEVDNALRLIPRVRTFLQQGLNEPSNYEELVSAMEQVFQ